MTMEALRTLVASVRRAKKAPEGFEDQAIEALASAATELGEPKYGWGIGFARVAYAGAQLLRVCPTERLAKAVLGLAALSGIGGDIVPQVRKWKKRAAIAKALSEYDRREAKATTYPAMRKAMKGYADEVFPRPRAKRAVEPLATRLSLTNGRVIPGGGEGAWDAYRSALRAATGPKRKGRDERRAMSPRDLTPKERRQLVGILKNAFGMQKDRFTVDDVFSGKSRYEVLNETAETPVEWWDVVDEKKKVRYQLWTYHADCGSLVAAGTTRRVASIIQFGFGVEVKDPGHELARAMELAHADLEKRCPKSALAGMDFSVDD